MEIPGLPPSLNHLYPTGKDGKRYLSKAGREWHQTVADACMAAGLRPFSDKKVRLRVVMVFVGMTYNRDVDGAVKATLDGLGGCLGFDDRYVEELSARRERVPYHQVPPSTRVELEEMSG